MSWRTSSYPNLFFKNRKLLQAAIIKPQIQWEVEPLIYLGYCVFAFYNEIKARSRAPPLSPPLRAVGLSEKAVGKWMFVRQSTVAHILL